MTRRTSFIVFAIALFGVVLATGLAGRNMVEQALAQAGGAPVAHAGYDRTVSAGDPVVLDGTRSTDLEGDKLTLSWSFVSVPVDSTAVLANTTQMKPSFTADLAGDYVIQLVANDGTLSSTPDTVTISTDNSAPTASAGRDRVVGIGEIVQLDASRSWDDDGDALTFSWTLVSAPVGSTAALSDSAAMQPTLVPDYTGDYVAELVVSDGVRSSDPATVTLGTDNVAPLTDAGNDLHTGTAVIPDGYRSGDTNGDTLSYSWSIVWGDAGLSAETDRRPTMSCTGGTDICVAQLITGDGVASGSPDTMVVIAGGNVPPVANAGPDQAIVAGDTVQLDATESYDINGGPIRFRWALTSVPNGSVAMISNPQAVTPNFTADLPGTYVAQLIASDDTEQGAPDTVVISTGNVAPVADAGPDQVPGSSAIQLNGSGSTDANNDTLIYRWSLIEVPARSSAAFSDPAAANPTFTADKAGVYTAQLYVSDGISESAPDTVTISTANRLTSASNARPVADAGADQLGVTPGSIVQLNAGGSSDADAGTGLAYNWTLIVKPEGSGATLSAPSAASTTFVADAGGIYVAQQIVKDVLLFSEPDTVVIVSLNRPPTANAGPDQSVLVGETAALDGTGSIDPDGDPLNYSWTLTGKPTGSGASLSGGATATPTLVPDIDGAYTIALLVDDGEFVSAPDSVTVTATNQPPVLDLIGPQTVDLGSTLTIQLAATDPNPGSTLTYSASPLPAGASLNGATGLFSFQPALEQVGAFNLTFSVSDGLLSDSESVSITVNGAPVGGTTAISGRILDTNDFTATGTITPVVGATISVLDAPTVTATSDAGGYFTLSGIPSGLQVLDLDTSTANLAPDGSPYAGFREELTLIADVTNAVDRPFYLPRIEVASLTTVSTTVDVTVTNARLGVSLLVTAGNARNPDGSPFTGDISISEVPLALAPASLPDLLKPGLLVTIQPVGVTFLDPAPITFPNINNLALGKQADLWSLDAASGAFSIVGAQEVSADGTQLTTVPGSGGIRAADWHAPLPAAPAISDDTPDTEKPCGCDAPSGSATSLHTGNLKETHSLVGYSSAGQGHSLQFVYNSTAADPRPIIKSDVAFPLTATTVVPDTVSTSLAVAGVAHGGTLFTDTSTLSRTGDEALRVGMQFDAGDLPTGMHQYETTVISIFQADSVGSRRTGQVRVRNERNSPFGAGWTLSGLSRLQVGAGSAILTGGDGSMSRYFQGGRFNDPIGSGAAEEILTGGRMAIADFNGDDILDMAIPDVIWTNYKVHLYLGDGNGAFPTHLLVNVTPPDYNGVCVVPVANYAGDFNEDNITDLATVLYRDHDCRTSSNQDYIAVNIGNGDGTFQPPAFLDGLYLHSKDATVGDFDDDTFLDIAVASGTSGQIKLFFGDGTGAFPLARRTETADYGVIGFGLIQAHDVDRDGDLDFVANQSLSALPWRSLGLFAGYEKVPEFLRSDSLLVFKNDGAGVFAAPATYPAGTMHSSPYVDNVEVADFNDDLYPDIAVNEVHDDTLSVFLNDGAGGFLPRIVHPMEGAWVATNTYMSGLSSADFNKDGRLDLVAGRFWDNEAMMIFHGAGDGSFVLSGEIALSHLPGNFISRKIDTSDHDRDGYPDLLAIADAYGSTASVWVFPGLQSSEIVYNSPDSDYSKLIQNVDGTFTRTLRNKTQIQFDANGYQTAITDLAGRTTSYTYDTSNRPWKITDAAGLVTTFNYVGDRIDNIVDPAGRTTRFLHDTAGNLIRITDPDDSFRQFAYDPEHRLVSQTDKRGSSKSYEFDSFGRHARSVWPDGTERLVGAVLTAGLPRTASGFGSSANPAPAVRPAEAHGSFRDGNNNKEIRKTNSFGFTVEQRWGVVNEGAPEETEARKVTTNRDANNNVTSIVAPERTTFLGYDLNGLLKTRLVYDKTTHTVPYSTYNQWRRWTYTYNALNKVETVDGPRTDVADITTYEYDPATGNLTKVTNALGHVTEITSYNAYGQPLTMLDANGVQTTLAYYPQGWLQSRTRDSGLGGTPATTSFTYDGAGNMTGTTLPDGSTLAYEYDGNGRVKAIENGAGERMEYTYDAAGNRTQTDVRAAGAPGDIVRTSSAVFDDLGRLLKSLGAYVGEETLYEYDGNGNVFRITDPLGNATQTAFDALNRVIKVTDPAVDGISGEAGYTYDTAGNRETATNQRNLVTSYIHNGFGEVIRQVSPDTGITDYVYDSAGNRIQRTDARSIETNWTYDVLGRPLTMEFPGSIAENVTYTYDDPTAGNYGIGRLASVADDSGSTAYVYDARGNVVQETSVIETPPSTAQTYVTEYAYDAADRLASMTYPSGRIVDYGRDALGRVTSVTTRENELAAAETLASAGTWEPFGGLDGLTYGNDVTLALGYDLDGRITAMDVFNTATPVLDLDYDQYDLAGNIRNVTDAGGTGRNRTYLYDALHRLSEATGDIPTESYTYDPVGNRLTRNADSYVYAPASNQLGSATEAGATRSLTYSASGNTEIDDRAAAADWTFAYDQTDRLVSVSEGTTVLGEYLHNAQGQRVAKTAGAATTHYIYDLSGRIIAEYDMTTAAWTEYVALEGMPLAFIATGSIYWVHGDHLGTPQVLTDAATGAVAWDANYAPFGEATVTGGLAFNQRFPGQYRDAETGLHYNYFRDYDNKTGRYTQSDPIGLQSGWNTYAYVGGNPVMRVDPRGLKWIFVRWHTNEYSNWWYHYRKTFAVCRSSCYRFQRMVEVLFEQWRPIAINTPELSYPAYGPSMSGPVEGAVDKAADLAEAIYENYTGCINKQKCLLRDTAAGQRACNTLNGKFPNPTDPRGPHP